MARNEANEDKWNEHYEKSKSHVEEGNYVKAIEELESAEEGRDLIYSDIGKSIAKVVKVWEALGDAYFQLADQGDESDYPDRFDEYYYLYDLAIRYYEQIEVFILQRTLLFQKDKKDPFENRELWHKIGCPFDIKQLWRKLGRAHDNKARLAAWFPRYYYDYDNAFVRFSEAIKHLKKALDYYERSDDGSLSQIGDTAYKLLQEYKRS